MPLIDFSKLKETRLGLATRLAQILGVDEGIHEINFDALKARWPETVDELSKWREANKPKQDEPDELRIDLNEAASRQRLVDEEAGLARLQWYADQRGLLPVPENAVAVKAFLDERLRGYWSAAGVDAAIANLRSTLQWKPKTPPPVTAPVQPEPIRLLDNGEPELPLTATETQMRRASIAQLRDLSRRRAEGRQTWRKPVTPILFSRKFQKGPPRGKEKLSHEQ